MNTLEQLLVLKVGTNVLTENGERLDKSAFRRIGRQALDIADSGSGVVLVSSGAITAGVLEDGRDRAEVGDMVELQRYAARGWDRVVQTWKSEIGANRVSATLLTKHELHSERTRDSALGVIACCLEHQDIVVVNENDVISDSEIKFGDNDTLAAELAAACAVSGLAKSIQLVLLTNIDGLRQNVNDACSVIREVTDIAAIEQFAGMAENSHSRGGMVTKIRAASIAGQAGVPTYIADGQIENAIQLALDGTIGTRFVANNYFSDLTE